MEFKDIKKKNRQEGSITLEATIFLILFISFYMVMISLMQLARAQVLLQYCAAETAKQISQCSYVLTKMGIVEKRVATSKQANAFKADFKNIISDIGKMESSLKGADFAGAYGHSKSLYNGIDDMAKDPDALINNVISLVKQYGADILSNGVIEILVENTFKKQVSNMTNTDPNIYLKNLGVKDGLNGLRFNNSSWAKDASKGMPELKVVVFYSMEPQIGIFKLSERNYCVCAKTALW